MYIYTTIIRRNLQIDPRFHYKDIKHGASIKGTLSFVSCDHLDLEFKRNP